MSPRSRCHAPIHEITKFMRLWRPWTLKCGWKKHTQSSVNKNKKKWYLAIWYYFNSAKMIQALITMADLWKDCQRTQMTHNFQWRHPFFGASASIVTASHYSPYCERKASVLKLSFLLPPDLHEKRRATILAAGKGSAQEICLLMEESPLRDFFWAN